MLFGIHRVRRQKQTTTAFGSIAQLVRASGVNRGPLIQVQVEKPKRALARAGLFDATWASCGMRLSKLSLTLLLLGIAGMLMGSVFKLMHLMGAGMLLLIGMVVTLVGLLFSIRDVWTKS